MHKQLIFILLFVSVGVKAQKHITFQSADSISYQYYLIGSWDQLINFGNEAILQNVKFKNLDKRVGYAYFAKANYYAAQKQYLKALTFDMSDIDSRLYLYYCAINNGDEAIARYHASKLPKETQTALNIKSFKLIDAIDVEYNYKSCLINTRSNPNYYRIGVNTQVGKRLTLYQSVSSYTQSTINPSTKIDNSQVFSSSLKKQSEYYVAVNWQVNSRISVLGAYHYLYAAVTDTTKTINSNLPKTDTKYMEVSTKPKNHPGNLFFGKVGYNLNRLELNLSASTYIMESETTNQIGIQAAYKITGKANLFFETAAYSMLETNNNHLVFSETIGLKLFKNTWLNGNITIGNLKNYSENNGLYVYNSEDETIFRTGATLFWSPINKITWFGNYGYDNKLITISNIKYNQHSFSTGIIWKL